MIHFWVIFVRGKNSWGWRAYSRSTLKNLVTAYRSKKEAKEDLRIARNIYGEARLYRFKAADFILGASKLPVDKVRSTYGQAFTNTGWNPGEGGR